ncbi:MFS transporter [Klebsiella pneumoniae]|nr:MFS transporter [Klebsiella pneumoniae]
MCTTAVLVFFFFFCFFCLFCPLISLFSLLSNRCLVCFLTNSGCDKYCWWIITGMLVMFAAVLCFYLRATVTIQHFSRNRLLVVIYLGFVLHAGAPAVEAFIEKVSRRSISNLVARGCLAVFGWALCASIVGIMFTAINNSFVFWLGFLAVTPPRRFTLFAQNGSRPLLRRLPNA